MTGNDPSSIRSTESGGYSSASSRSTSQSALSRSGSAWTLTFAPTIPKSKSELAGLARSAWNSLYRRSPPINQTKRTPPTKNNLRKRYLQNSVNQASLRMIQEMNSKFKVKGRYRGDEG